MDCNRPRSPRNDCPKVWDCEPGAGGRVGVLKGHGVTALELEAAAVMKGGVSDRSPRVLDGDDPRLRSTVSSSSNRPLKFLEKLPWLRGCFCAAPGILLPRLLIVLLLWRTVEVFTFIFSLPLMIVLR